MVSLFCFGTWWRHLAWALKGSPHGLSKIVRQQSLLVGKALRCEIEEGLHPRNSSAEAEAGSDIRFCNSLTFPIFVAHIKPGGVTCRVMKSRRRSPTVPTSFSRRRRREGLSLFVPWCSGARIHREDEREIIADLVIGFGPFQESFTSQVTLERPRQVLVRAIEGPLEHLTNIWTFTPVRA